MLLPQITILPLHFLRLQHSVLFVGDFCHTQLCMNLKYSILGSSFNSHWRFLKIFVFSLCTCFTTIMRKQKGRIKERNLSPHLSNFSLGLAGACNYWYDSSNICFLFSKEFQNILPIFCYLAIFCRLHIVVHTRILTKINGRTDAALEPLGFFSNNLILKYITPLRGKLFSYIKRFYYCSSMCCFTMKSFRANVAAKWLVVWNHSNRTPCHCPNYNGFAVLAIVAKSRKWQPLISLTQPPNEQRLLLLTWKNCTWNYDGALQSTTFCDHSVSDALLSLCIAELK